MKSGSYNGIDWLVREHCDWIDAEYCINLDGGEFEKQKNKHLSPPFKLRKKSMLTFS